MSNKNKLIITGAVSGLIGVLIGLGASSVITTRTIDKHVEETQVDYNKKKTELVEIELGK